MKRTFCIVLFLVLMVNAHVSAGGSQWMNTIDEALSRAKSESKPIMLYFYMRGSESCEEFESLILSDSRVSKIMDENMINVGIDVNNNMEIASNYGITKSPGIIIFTPNGEPVVEIIERRDPERFAKIIGALAKTFESATEVTQEPSSPPRTEIVHYIPMNQVTASKIGQTVTVKGSIVNAISPSSGTAPYSYYVSDGTETLRIVIWPDIYKAIPDKERFQIEKDVIATGEVKEFYNRLEIHIAKPGDFRLADESVTAISAPSGRVAQKTELPSQPTSIPSTGIYTSISNITSAMLGQVVSIKGTIQNIRPSWQPSAPNTVSVQDSSGRSIDVVYWPDVARELPPDQHPRIDSIMEATGTVDEYRGNLQIKIDRASNIKVEHTTAQPTPVTGVITIGSISRQLIGQKVTITGKITRSINVSGGKLLTVTDDSGSITVPLWDSVTEIMPDRDKIRTGAKVKISGQVILYERRQELEIQISSAGDITVL